MVKPIVHDIFFLGQKSEPATKKDALVIADLLDTLQANADDCAGLAANMIGVKKRIIVYRTGSASHVMVNPTILRQWEPYEAEEGCLSLDGERTTTRYRIIEVSYLNHKFKPKTQRFTGWTAQVIQHEIDHCNGIII